jgi:transcriptional antiterminator RfaH
MDNQHYRAELLGKRWAVAWCNLNHEARAQDGLVRAHYTPFSPSRVVVVRRADRKMLVRKPLFPRYILVGLDEGQSWYPILSTPGVTGLITNNDKPVYVPKWVMEKLFEADAAQAFDGPKQYFREGQKVKIVGGHLEGFVAEIMRASESRRITVLLEMFGKKQKLTLPVEQVRAA